MQKMLIEYILTPVSRVMSELSQKTRDRLFFLGGLGIVLHYFARDMRLVGYPFLVFFAISCVFLGIMILGSLGGEVKPVKFNRFLGFCWFGVGSLMLLSGVRNNISYLPDAVLILVALPVLFICWNSSDRSRIFRLLLKICKTALVVFVVGSFLLVKITTRKYPGLFVNQNSTSYFLAVAGVCLIIDIIYAEGFSRKLVSDILWLGLAMALNYYTGSRTGTLAVICAVALGGVIYALTHPWRDVLKCLVRGAAAALVVWGCISSLVYVFQLRQWLPLPYYDVKAQEFYMDPRWEKDTSQEDPPETESSTAETENSESESSTAETENSETESSTAETESSTTGTEPADTAGSQENEFFGVDGFDRVNDQKTDTSGKSLDSFSTGRITVWSTYAKDLNLWGHENTPVIYVEVLQDPEISSTHMTILQVGYESGIIAGVLYLLLNLGSGVAAIVFAWKNREEKYALMPVMLTVTFGVLSVLASLRVAFWHWSTLLYYFMLCFVMTSAAEEK